MLNDLDGEIVNVFRVLQQPETFDKLMQMLVNTPYARAELGRAIEIESSDKVERAWKFMVRTCMGYGGRIAKSANSWGRTFTSATYEGMAELTSAWRKRMKTLPHWHDRLTRVQIDNRDAIEVIKYWDTPDTVFYIDPPYVSKTRKSGGYTHEMTDNDHLRLVDTLLKVKGKVLLSGYESDIYRSLEDAGWYHIEFKTVCHSINRTRDTALRGKGSATAIAPRTEILWMNYKYGPIAQGKLFNE